MDSIPRIRRELVARFEGLVRTRARALAIGPDEFGAWVKEVVGEGIALAIARQDKWNREKGDFLHWAFLQTRSLVKNELRQQERHQKAVQACERAFTEPKTSFSERLLLHLELVDILKQLNVTEQKALVLYYLQGLTVATLSEILGKRPKTVYGLLNRARRKALHLYRNQAEPTDLDEEQKNVFEESVRNPDSRVYTCSEGVLKDDVSF
jgi:RNA polymerase sigma factor (sigma-70 family)